MRFCSWRDAGIGARFTSHIPNRRVQRRVRSLAGPRLEISPEAGWLLPRPRSADAVGPKESGTGQNRMAATGWSSSTLCTAEVESTVTAEPSGSADPVARKLAQCGVELVDDMI